MTMRPIATILLDTPDSYGPVRGVLSLEDRSLYCYDPRTGERIIADEQTAGKLASVRLALEAAQRLWGGAAGWELTFLCFDTEDYEDVEVTP